MEKLINLAYSQFDSIEVVLRDSIVLALWLVMWAVGIFFMICFIGGACIMIFDFFKNLVKKFKKN